MHADERRPFGDDGENRKLGVVFDIPRKRVVPHASPLGEDGVRFVGCLASRPWQLHTRRVSDEGDDDGGHHQRKLLNFGLNLGISLGLGFLGNLNFL